MWILTFICQTRCILAEFYDSQLHLVNHIICLQLILKANNGMDYGEFYRFLYTVAECRINTLQKYKHSEQERDEYQHPTKAHLNHLVFDILQIKDLVFLIKRNKEFLQVDLEQFTIRPKALIKSIEDVIDEYMSKLS